GFAGQGNLDRRGRVYGGISERFQFWDSLGRGDYHHNCSDHNGNEQQKAADSLAGTHQLAGSVSRMTS
ncbi:hypothetical protein, partial [Marinobacter sp.]|uniref:hypothetical protein n=1 Tax=Marinobacter sp. TaxID=50741 RepID=UPI003298CEB2